MSSKTDKSKATPEGGRHVDSALHNKTSTLAEDVHLFIGGSCVLRFFSTGDMQVPSDPEKRAAILEYVNTIKASLEELI